MLEANGVHEAVVVTGFHDELVNQAIDRRSGGPNVRTIYNPFYKVADNTGSLFMAREELTDDCLVWNGDTLVSRGLMARVVANDADRHLRDHRPKGHLRRGRHEGRRGRKAG